MKFSDYLIEDAIKYNMDRDKPLTECVFRRESEYFSKYFDLLRENLDELKLDDFDKKLLETDIGRTGQHEGKEVWLDLPYINEAEYKGKDVELDKPKRNNGSDGKKYYVYTKNSKGNVIKVTFGDKKGGLTAKIGNVEARKSFAARHQCSQKNDKTKPGYWACRLPWYAKSLGLSDGGKFWW